MSPSASTATAWDPASPSRSAAPCPPFPFSPPNPALRGRSGRRMGSAGSRRVCCRNGGVNIPPPAAHWGVSGQRPAGSVPTPQLYGGRGARRARYGPTCVPRVSPGLSHTALLPPPNSPGRGTRPSRSPKPLWGGCPPPSAPIGEQRGVGGGGVQELPLSAPQRRLWGDADPHGSSGGTARIGVRGGAVPSAPYTTPISTARRVAQRGHSPAGARRVLPLGGGVGGSGGCAGSS